MSGHRSWSADRKARLADPKVATRAAVARAEAERVEQEYLQTLSQLRHARRLTQAQLGAALGVSQAQVSRIENQADLYLSTLRSYVEAMGGQLELRAVFLGGQASLLSVDEVLGPESAGQDPAGSVRVQADLRALFAQVILHAGRMETAEERFRAALAA
jgi:transcriptional regulator with XRE-family HTH domain